MENYTLIDLIINRSNTEEYDVLITKVEERHAVSRKLNKSHNSLHVLRELKSTGPYSHIYTANISLITSKRAFPLSIIPRYKHTLKIALTFNCTTYCLNIQRILLYAIIRIEDS